jgi:GNAT superfamily N-acetyltransferase
VTLGEPAADPAKSAPVTIRAAVAADAPAIAQLHAASWRRTYRGMISDDYLDGDLVADRLSVWSRRLDTPRPDQRVWVAHDRAGLVGFACVFADAPDCPQWGVFLDNLHVRPDLKSQGLGSALLRTVATWVCDGRSGQGDGAGRPRAGLWLWVLEANEAARGFYRRYGGVERDRVVVADPVRGSTPTIRCGWPNARAILDR